MSSTSKKPQYPKDTMYSSAAEFGRIMAIIGLVLAIIMGIGMIVFGIIIIVNSSKYTSVTGTVEGDSSCQTTTTYDKNGNSNVQTSCTTKVTYNVSGTKYTNTFNTDGTSYKDQDTLTVYYQTNDPSQSQTNLVPAYVGWILIGAAVLIMVMAAVWVWVTIVNRFGAIVGATSAAVGMVSRAI
jgi:hypothetical protein